MVMVRSLPDIFVGGRDRCRGLLRGLYGQSDGTGKGAAGLPRWRTKQALRHSPQRNAYVYRCFRLRRAAATSAAMQD